MSGILRMCALAVCLIWSSQSWAGDLEIRSETPVVVMRGGVVAGTTPLTLSNLPAGPLELGFRETALGATVFSQKVTIPATGLIGLQVNLAERTATILPASPAQPLATTPPVEPAVPTGPAGDVYVSSTPAGAKIWLDGKDTGQVTPFMIRGVSTGKHAVQVRTECTRAQGEVTVTNGVIVRSELTLAPGTGTLSIGSAPTGSRVLIDGVEVGKAPGTFKDQSCGEHTVAVRAPGYLEEIRTVKVPAFEVLVVEMPLKKEEFGTLVLDVTPLETAVKVDQIEVGTGPRTLDHIATGSHTVEGSLDGYTTQTSEVVVTPNAVARLNLSLQPVSAATSEPLPTRPVKTPKPAPTNTGRILLNSAVSLIGIGSTTYGVVRFMDASEAFQRYQTVESDNEAERIYEVEVTPNRTQAYVFGGVGIAALGAATGLWITTDF